MKHGWLAGLAGLVLVAWQGPAEARPGPRLLISWNALPGQPRATDRLEQACDDTTRADTLYLAFESPRPYPAIVSMTAVVYFHPQVGDTLGEFWQFKTGWPNGGNMFVDFAPLFGLPCFTPWTDVGERELSYDHRSGRGRLDLSYTIPARESFGLDPGVRYCYAAVRILSRRSSLPGCGQPVCVEWAGARLRFGTGREVEITAGDQRFVRWNTAPDAPCRGGGTKLARPWAPRVGKPGPGR